MQIKNMFRKDIDRDIQGVIIVGQGAETNAAQELEEYVVTRELQKHFAEFFAAYKKGILSETPKMGVWISGFFGSGKSHFLKILSYLLANREVGGKHAIDYFAEDEKIKNEKVMADMRLAAETPTDAILFNIDSKSESNGKKNKDAIVSVFLKVFNEMQGFYGANPHVADMERELTEKGLYADFEAAFEKEYGASWKGSRHKFIFITDPVAAALSSIGFMSEDAAKSWCRKALGDYKISIEGFARLVRAYLDKKGNDHHIVFLADEVGQYIGEDSNLMLNLQTVTEELGKECMGRAWVVVTSQQDIDAFTKVKGNDFSKIQGRFDTRLSLSSANVDAVIRKRILEKTETAADTLRLLYESEATKIKNNITFNDSVEKKLYADENDFAEVYPFLPYQFRLLQNVLNGIRKKGAAGKHLSEGARSMLALFKESAARCRDEETGILMPFSAFYAPLEKFIDHSHADVIRNAYTNSIINPDGKEDVFAVDVLKLLFLVRYLENDVDPNAENLTSLMIAHIDEDRLALKEKVEDALRVLLGQKLIQKNGSRYQFLTNEEQEINREIEKENVEMAAVIAKISEIIFADILPESKYRHPAFSGRYAFPFNETVDDRPYKTGFGIGLRVLTPWYEGASDAFSLTLRSKEDNEVILLLPEDQTFLEEMQAYLKIERFLRKAPKDKVTDYEIIKAIKNKEMHERSEQAKRYLKEAMQEASLYVNGEPADIRSKDVQTRVNEAMGLLVGKVFHKLSYIDTPVDKESIDALFRHKGNTVLGLGETAEANNYALDDVRVYIRQQTTKHMKTSMKTLKERFTGIPYGFIEDDVQWLVACLFTKGDISFTVNGENVNANNRTPDELMSYVTKKQYLEKLLTETRTRVPDNQKKSVRGIIKELFKSSAASDDEDEIMKLFAEKSKNMQTKIRAMEDKYKYHKYPGKKVLDTGLQLLQGLDGIFSPTEFFKSAAEKEDALLDFEEDFEEVRDFFDNKNQRRAFNDALDTLTVYKESKNFITAKEIHGIAQKMQAIVSEERPYGKIKDLPTLREAFLGAYDVELEKMTAGVLPVVEDAKKRVLDELAEKPYKAEKESRCRRLFDEIIQKAKSEKNMMRVTACKEEARVLRDRLLAEMHAKDAEKPPKPVTPGPKPQGGEEAAEKPVGYGKKTKTISIGRAAAATSWKLEKAEDIDRYLAALRQDLLKELEENTTVYVEF